MPLFEALRDELANLVAQPWKARRFDARLHVNATVTSDRSAYSLLSIDYRDAEDRYLCEPQDDMTAEKIFERKWAMTVLQTAMAKLAAEQETAGKMPRFDGLKMYLGGDKNRVPYRELAERLNMLKIAIVGLIAVPLVGYVVLIHPHRTSFELNELKREYSQRRSEVSRVKKTHGNSPELSRVNADFDAWQDAARERCMQIVATESDKPAGATALLLVIRWWPDSPEAKDAHAQLLDATDALPMDVLGEVLNNARVGKHDELETWRPFVARIITRVEREPDHADSAWVLSRASIFVNPERYSTTSPCEEFVAIGALILNRFAAREGIQNFCEVVGGQGNASQWGLAYEPHLRQILKVNQDRLVQCTAKYSLASIVRAGGIERQAEAEKLFAEFLVEFDGQTEYHAQGVEVDNRKSAQRILAGMRQHGLGKPAIATVGVDLDGRPMALVDYRGKVVLLSFWATWCGPCIRAIPHEKELLKHFGSENFAIVGVNGDSQNPDRALDAVKEHGITWRSFQNKSGNGSSIEGSWHVGGWPTFYLLDTDGTIANTWQGMPAQPVIRTAIAELIDANQSP